MCQSRVVMFLCCLVSVMFLPGGVPFFGGGGGSVRVLSLQSSVIHGFVTEP